MKNLRLCLLVLVTILFSTCKKGPDDPALSLRSRKARVTGKWHLKEGSVSVTLQESGKAPYNYLFTLDGTKATENVTQYNNTPVIYTFAYILSVEFKDDGTFSMKETLSGDILEASGTWNFTGKMGKDKNKEGIVLFIDKIKNGSTGDLHLFNGGSTDFAFKIRELRNKTMVLDANAKDYITSKGDFQDYMARFTLIQ